MPKYAYLRAFISVALSALFICALGWVLGAVKSENEELDGLYRSVTVSAHIESASGAASTASYANGFISQGVIDELCSGDYAKNVYLVATADWGTLMAVKAIVKHGISRTITNYVADESRAVENVRIYASNEPNNFFAENNLKITYAEGWDESMFKAKWTSALFSSPLSKGVLSSKSILDTLGVAPGERMHSISANGLAECSFKAAGYFEDSDAPAADMKVIMPLSLLKAMCGFTGEPILYSVARFDIDPSENKDLAAFAQKLSEPLSHQKSGLASLRLAIDDGELNKVLAPSKEKLKRLETLYTAVAALCALAAVALPILTHSEKDAKALLDSGFSKRKTRAALLFRYIVFGAFGAWLGILAAALIWRDAAALIKPLILYAALYSAGAVAGSVAASFIAAHKAYGKEARGK